MNEPELRAREGVVAMAQGLKRSGVLSACRDLFATVWSINVARHEPEELGDTAMSLGLQTHQNFITRAERRFQHDEREPEESHWHCDGLSIARSGNAFVMRFDGGRISVMKTPYEHGRQLRPEHLAKWDGQSHLRAEMASRNSTALGNHRSDRPGDVPLFAEPAAECGVVRDFLLIFAGEPRSTLTAAWLGVPVLGEDPLIAVERLWWDEESALAPVETMSVSAGGVSFEEREVPPLNVTLKPGGAQEMQQ